jgi:DNA-binding NarL/FixJ family response regulator
MPVAQATAPALSIRPCLRKGQIASELFLSPKTIRNNVTSILAKLQATDRAEVIVRARDDGLGADTGSA